MGQLGKMLLVVGLVIALAGGLMIAGERLGLGRLPGDLVFRGKRWTVHLPLATSVLLSLLLSLLLTWLLRRK